MHPAPDRIARRLLHEARTLVRLDAVPSAEVLRGPALRARRRRIEWSRHAVQAGFLLAVLLRGRVPSREEWEAAEAAVASVAATSPLASH